MKLMAFHIKRRLWLWIPAALVTATVLLTAYLILSLPDVSPLAKQNPKITALMELRLNQAKKHGRKFFVKQSWVPFGQVPQLLKDAIRIAEDAGFYRHKGIDYDELKESIKKDIREKQFVRGGSTITQQLAKNLYLSTEKNLVRKFKELLIAKRLEKSLTKDRIFELYLNVIEMGPGIFGVEAAAWHYFEHPAGKLDLEEMVRLTAIIPRPLTTDPRGDTPWLRWRGRWILHILKLHKFIDEVDYQRTVWKFPK